MIPALFQWASDSVAVKTLLGDSPTRFWPFGDAPQKGEPMHCLPYAVWQVVYGAPDNYVNQAPDSDNVGIQIDIYGRTPKEARAVMLALRDAIEPHGVVNAYGGETRESGTGLYRSTFTAEFWTDR